MMTKRSRLLPLMTTFDFCDTTLPCGQRDLTIDGDFPHNTSGGQLSAGQAGAAGGYLGLVEAIRQVTGMAGPTQVAAARLALVSGFGMINYDRGVCSGAVIISGGSS